MEVQLRPDQEARLSHLASTQGRAAEALIQEAIERLLHHDEWFLSAVDQGLAAADRHAFVEHEDVRKMIERRFPA